MRPRHTWLEAFKVLFVYQQREFSVGSDDWHFSFFILLRATNLYFYITKFSTITWKTHVQFQQNSCWKHLCIIKFILLCKLFFSIMWWTNLRIWYEENYPLRSFNLKNCKTTSLNVFVMQRLSVSFCPETIPWFTAHIFPLHFITCEFFPL